MRICLATFPARSTFLNVQLVSCRLFLLALNLSRNLHSSTPKVNNIRRSRRFFLSLRWKLCERDTTRIIHIMIVHGTLIITSMSLMPLILACWHVCINILGVNISPIDHGHASVLIYHYDLVNYYNLIIDARLLLCSRMLRWWQCS